MGATGFADRRDAGRRLAARMHGDTRAAVVLALPRGGVPVAAPIADALGAPLDVLVAHKLGLPWQPEYGVGAIAEDDDPVFNDAALTSLGLTDADLTPVVAREREEMARRVTLYRGGRRLPELTGLTAVLVDDGLATGITAVAAARCARAGRPAALMLAVPVGAPEAVELLGPEVDDVICLDQPRRLGAVGAWYEDFHQVTDDEVLALLGTHEERRS